MRRLTTAFPLNDNAASTNQLKSLREVFGECFLERFAEHLRNGQLVQLVHVVRSKNELSSF